MPTESTLKSAFMREAKQSLPGFVLIRHEDVRTSGTPDLSVTGHGRTSWWEFKKVPPLSGTEFQTLMCGRLAAAGYCRYVIWHEKGNTKRTLVVEPRHLNTLTPETWCLGFNHRWLCDVMRGVHRA